MKTLRQFLPADAVVQLVIRLGLLALLITWTFLIIKPFVPILTWSAVLAVAFYPVFSWLAINVSAAALALRRPFSLWSCSALSPARRRGWA
ncbi:putative PurR-regulated permease PerM [Bradyrhizobium sp. GM24.11]